MRVNNYYSLLFRWACRLLKYFLLALFGFTLFCILSTAFGELEMVTVLIQNSWIWIVRIGLLVLGVMAIAIVCESIRQ